MVRAPTSKAMAIIISYYRMTQHSSNISSAPLPLAALANPAALAAIPAKSEPNAIVAPNAAMSMRCPMSNPSFLRILVCRPSA